MLLEAGPDSVSGADEPSDQWPDSARCERVGGVVCVAVCVAVSCCTLPLLDPTHTELAAALLCGALVLVFSWVVHTMDPGVVTPHPSAVAALGLAGIEAQGDPEREPCDPEQQQQQLAETEPAAVEPVEPQAHRRTIDGQVHKYCVTCRIW